MHVEQRLWNIFNSFEIGDSHAIADVAVCGGAFVDMGERQEFERNVRRQKLVVGCAVDGIRAEIRMREHHALGFARCA